MKFHKKKTLYIILVICIISTCIYSISKPYFTFKLNGSDTVIVSLHHSYKETGTSQSNATVTGKVNTDKAGNYTLTYTYHNKQLKRVVKVVDPSRVIFAYKGDETTIVKKGNAYIEPGCCVFDKEDGFITDKVKVSGKVNSNKVGTYRITYSVTNSAGYTLKKNRTVKVVDEDNYEWADSIPVLMYHWVYTKESTITHLSNNYILDTTLQEELNYLKEEDYYYPSFNELAAFIEGKISLPKKSVIITFDDGANRFLKYGTPLINQIKIPVTSFMIGIKDGDRKVKDYFSPYVTFQSHSYNMHRGGGLRIGHGGIISALSQEEIEADLNQSVEQVDNHDAFAYPFGDTTDTAKTAVKNAQFKVAFTTENRRCSIGDDLYALPRVRISGYYTLEKFKEIID